MKLYYSLDWLWAFPAQLRWKEKEGLLPRRPEPSGLCTDPKKLYSHRVNHRLSGPSTDSTTEVNDRQLLPPEHSL